MLNLRFKAEDAKNLVSKSDTKCQEFLDTFMDQIEEAAKNGLSSVDVVIISKDYDLIFPHGSEAKRTPALDSIVRTLQGGSFKINTFARTYEARGSGEELKHYCLTVSW